MCATGTSRLRPIHVHSGRAARAGRVRCSAAARGALGRGVVGVAGPRELEGALLEADDAVAGVLGVRVDGRRHDPRQDVMREEVGRVSTRSGSRDTAPVRRLCAAVFDRVESCGGRVCNSRVPCVAACVVAMIYTDPF